MSSEESTRFWDDLEASWQARPTRGDQHGSPRADGLEHDSLEHDGLEAKVRRQSRRLALTSAAEAVVGLVFLVTAVRLATAADAGLFDGMTAAGIIVLVTVAALYSVVNRRGLWRAASATPEAYLALLRRRSAARLRSLRFALGLLAVETLAFACWIPAASTSGRGLVVSYLFLATWSGGALVVILVLRRRALGEHAALDRHEVCL